MKALIVLYGGRLGEEAFEKVLPGGAEKEKTSAFSLAVTASGRFPGAQKIVLLGLEGKEYPVSPEIQVVSRPSWNRQNLLEELSRLSAGYDFAYFAWADCPLLDPALAAALAERHIRFGAEYSYADGWPYGFAPELLNSQTAGILSKLAGGEPVDRDALFQVIQKDINAFDLETEISPWDLRQYRITLAADSRRNLLLLGRWMETGCCSSADAEKVVKENPGLLRTLPAFFNIQVSGACPQTCSLCPWPVYGGKAEPVTARKDFMTRAAFGELLDKIAAFAGDGVIGLSLWGELALHPERTELIEMVLARPALSLVVETSGIGWNDGELELLARSAASALPRKNHMAPLSWIVSLDAHDADRYREVRGPGFSEARSCAKKLLSLFPNDAYVQALRVNKFEDDIERFYRAWKGEDMPGELLAAGRKDGSHVIIQKYDDFAGALPKLQATDLSPVTRRPCWHIQRDMNIFPDGRVPRCREDLAAINGEGAGILGNVFTEELGPVWERGAALYKEHCGAHYKGICEGCDEYYTYNF